MKPCTYRKPLNDTHVRCSNTHDLLHSGTVPISLCELCPYAKEKPADFFTQTAQMSTRTRSKVVPKPCGGCNQPAEPKVSVASRHDANVPGLLPVHVTEWAVGVSAGVRRIPVVGACVESLIRNGWDPVVFAEPGVVPIENVRWIQRPETVGPMLWKPEQISPEGRFGIFQNYLQTLVDLLAMYPDAQAILYVQDDVIFADGVREFLERDLWPSQNTGLVSPYCPNEKGYRTEPPQCRRVDHNYLISGQTYCFPRAVAVKLVEDAYADKWRGAVGRTEPIPWKRKALDAYTGLWMDRHSLKTYFYSPSLCDHYEPEGMGGKNTTTGNGPHKGFRRAYKWIGLEANPYDHLKHPWVRYDLPSQDQRFPEFSPAESSPDPIHVVIPGVDNPNLTKSCIDHVVRSTVPVHVCYVDNGSSLESLQQITDHLRNCGTTFAVIRNDTNEGFTTAVRQGFDSAAGRHVLILNNDCRVSRFCLEKLLHHLERHPKVASICPSTADHGRCSLRRKANQKESGVTLWTGDPDEVQERLTRFRVQPQDVLPWFCCLLHRDALAEFRDLPAQKAFKSGLVVDDYWSLQLRKRGWMHLLAYDAFAAHDHMTTFRKLGIDRGKLFRDAQRKLREVMK